MGGFDAYVVEVEHVFGNLWNGEAEHYASGKVDKVYFKHFAYEWEAAGCAEVALYHFDVIILRQILYIERTGYVEFFCNFPAYALDAAHGFNVEFLGGETDGGVAAVHAGKFDVFAYRIDDYLAVLGNCIHFYFHGVLNELAYHNGVLFAYVGGQLQESFEFFGVGAYVHGGSA